MTNKTNSHNDVFAQIGASHLTNRHELVEPAPIPFPKRSLPVQSTRRPAFRPTPKLNNSKQLYRKLQTYRRNFAKFQRHLSPGLDSCRITLPLREFNWRCEQAQDRSNFQRVLQGKGKWTRVTLPHYGPPLGKAVTYYQTSFDLTPEMLEKGCLFVCFDGVDYQARVYENHAFVGSHEGFFAPFEFDFSAHARIGKNTLVVQVMNDAIQMGNDGWGESIDGNKIYAATGPGYDDPDLGWHHCPPGMGIYQDVRIEAREQVFVGDIYVRPLLEEQTIEAWIEIFNSGRSNMPVELDLSVYGKNFRKTVMSGYRYRPQTSQIRGHGDVVKSIPPRVDQLMGPGVNYLRISLDVPQPRQWASENPWLYQLQVKVLNTDGDIVDTAEQHFGMRSFVQDEDSQPKGKFYLNGQEIRLRGANTMGHMQQCVMQRDWEQLRDDILLAKICNMNFLRLTQRPVQKEIYDYCDQLGLMTQTDLPMFGVLRRNQLLEAVKQAQEMERLVRPHPCNIIISYINEPFPNAQGKPHRHLARPELEEFFEMASKAVRMANPERVIKCVDGDYDPPSLNGMPDNHCYCGWYNGHALDLGKLHRGYWLPIKPGWLYGCGEFGAEGLDPEALMKKYYPKSWLPKTASEVESWTPAVIRLAQTYNFHFSWYETPKGLPAWVEASQDHQAWIVKLMTEAFRRDPRMITFAIHLFIDAWPGGWMKTIMDRDRQPKKSYFAYRDALAPLMVSLRSDRFSFRSGESMDLEAWICNDTAEVPDRPRLAYQLEIGGKVVQAGNATAEVPVHSADGQGVISFQMPSVQKRTRATARLALLDRQKKIHDHTALTVDIFPALLPLPRERVLVLGERNGGAADLVRQLGLQPTFKGAAKSHKTILIDSPELYEQHSKEIDIAVRQGARAVFLTLPGGQHNIDEDTITIDKSGMGLRHFASRNTGHRLVRDFEVNDFKFWYDSSVGYVKPILGSVVTAPGWVPILMSGNGFWKGKWQPVGAAVEKSQGRGFYRICQVNLPHRIEGNPAAELFARRLLCES